MEAAPETLTKRDKRGRAIMKQENEYEFVREAEEDVDIFLNDNLEGLDGDVGDFEKYNKRQKALKKQRRQESQMEYETTFYSSP